MCLYKSKNQEIKITSLSEYIQKIQKIKEKYNYKNFDLLFRGQEAEFKLLPKIQRLTSKISDLHKCEKLITKEFKRNLENIDWAENKEWYLLTLAQHYGLPTRFLDWSYSALCALWFSVKNAQKNTKNTFVYVLTTENISVWNDWENFKSPFDIDKILIYRPEAITERIKAQNSVFTVHPIQLKNICIKENPDYKIFKFFINNPYEIKKQLDDCGVNEYSIFPDLNGLCSYLQWRYFK